ncbi:GDYXXLXY domain-containing protein [Sporosarcina obsidiansis]|uniref:GDYXXLXY domain-containing protein n=1 Tax=Sporosarcina obsidiansis TaxID=2660748 RepID=UPI00129A66E4|nr:GDYXXLXY domain-containing protein [Sporosarcina obsidiansis]
MKNKRNLFFIAIIIPMLLLLSMLWKPLWTLNVGTPILLETIPVDPRDLLYGDYVSLRFAVEEVKEQNIDPDLLHELSDDTYGELAVYAVLQQEDGGKYGLKTVTANKPEDEVFLTGQMNRYAETLPGQETIYYADFLPDRFYVPENTGKRLEELSREGQLVAKLMIHDGYAILQDIMPK